MGSTHVFVDHGFQHEIFKQQFISQEFTVQSLRELVSVSKNKRTSDTPAKTKEELVKKVLGDLNTGQLTTNDLLLNYVKRPRMWLSFKFGQYKELSKIINPASQLIDSFGDDGWYGPIVDKESDKMWLIRIQKVTEKYYMGIGEGRQISERQYR